MNTEKQVQHFKIDYDLDWLYTVDIKQIRKDLDEIEKLGATHVEIESYSEWDTAYTEVKAVSVRMETDEECKARINEYNARQELIKQRELAQLEQLKAKYGL